MFVSIATTRRPATDLGFLLMKHPDRVHDVELKFGKGIVLFPEATDAVAAASAFILIGGAVLPFLALYGSTRF